MADHINLVQIRFDGCNEDLEKNLEKSLEEIGFEKTNRFYRRGSSSSTEMMFRPFRGRR